MEPAFAKRSGHSSVVSISYKNVAANLDIGSSMSRIAPFTPAPLQSSAVIIQAAAQTSDIR
jgi:hypothetical protein